MRSRFINYWGTLKQFQVPTSVVQDETLVLSARALAVLLYILYVAKGQAGKKQHQILAAAKVTLKSLTERTGLSKNTITEATKELDAKGFIKRITGGRRKRGEFGANEYLVCNPSSGEPLLAIGSNLFLPNKVRYVNVPKCLVTEFAADWSLAQLTGSEIRLYVAVLWLANRPPRSGMLKTSESALRKLSGLGRPTFDEALERLECRHLLWITGGQKDLCVTLCDPYTGEPIHEQTGISEDDPANYYEVAEKGRAKRLNMNSGTPEQVRALLLSCLSENAKVVSQENGDVKICCPFHEDQNPSCSVSPEKRCFYCFGCRQKGTFTALLMRLRSMSKAEAVQFMAASLGFRTDFHRPDEDAEAIYPWLDKNGKLVKEVLRFPGKEFQQRRPAGGWWVYDTDGIPPMLYNLHRLEFAQTAALCEGEKDCDTLMRLGLEDSYGHDVVATTSGGSDSWRDELADELLGKQVIVMPDSDEAGARYAAAIRASLERRGIPYRVVTFSDVGAKDVTEYLEQGHSKEELIDRMGDWVRHAKVPQPEPVEV